ncbi:MAG TPA: hypothetical protein VHY20_15495, partial [Pirellulales bacterium]|nr:hypothetical protein [Pirellulales bacterium]
MSLLFTHRLVRLVAPSLCCLLLAAAGSGAWADEAAPLVDGLDARRIDALKRVDRDHRATPEEQQSCSFVFNTKAHPASGQAYVIVTDHRDQGYNAALQRLAKHHRGSILRVDDLARLADDAAAREDLRSRLRAAGPRFVAIAPRPASYSENMLLSMWEVLSTLDSDPQLDAFPGLLVAPNETAFSALVERSIHHKPQAAADIRPFIVGQTTDSSSVQGQRSLQKIEILRNLFDQYGQTAASLTTRGGQARTTRSQPPAGPQQWSVATSGPREFITELPAPAKDALDRSSLLLMFGHGVPGMTCSLDVKLFHSVAMADKVVLCGSCFSAAPQESDFPAMRQGEDGSDIRNDRERFIMRAIENGAVVAHGHMRLNGGFPEVYTVLESWMHGRTVGEAYQRLINAIIEVHDFSAGEFIL